MKHDKYAKLRDEIYKSALILGEDLMPWDLVELIEAENIDNWKDKVTLLEDIYASCGFVLPPKDSKRDIYNLYF